MPDESALSVTPEIPTRGRRGPKKESQIRAEVEAELRAKVEAEVRAEMMREAAQKRAAAEASSPMVPHVSGLDLSGDPSAPESVTIHFVDDGFTVLGKVWYRGEELTLEPGSQQWEEAPSYRGKIFALLDEFEQEEIWGRRFFREGLWRGKRLSEIDDPELTSEDRVALERAEMARSQKYRGVSPVTR
jgi:hypothetical protein